MNWKPIFRANAERCLAVQTGPTMDFSLL